MDAQPNKTHLALAALVRCGLVQEWLTTNYDGLAQKAGCPQEKVAELHGSWFDPSNPILGRRGTIQKDLALRLEEAAETADLVLVMGSSLSGGPSLCAASRPAQRSLEGCCLGSIVVNLQATPLDGQATVRVFADTDTLMQRLVTTMNLTLEPPKVTSKIKSKAKVPYDSSGEPTSSEMTELCLHPGSGVRLSPQHNCQSAGQPSRAHIGGGELVREGGRVTRRAIGEGRVVRYCATQRAWELEVEGVKMLLGYWWLEAAVRGALPFLPIINIGIKPARFQTIVRQKIMKTQKVAFHSGRKIDQEGEIGLDGVESGERPFAENNPNLTDCPISRENSNVVEKEEAKDRSQPFSQIDAEEEPGREQLEVEATRWESIQETVTRKSPSIAEQPKTDYLPIDHSKEEQNSMTKKENPSTLKPAASEIQESGDSGYETSAPLGDEIKKHVEGILGLKTDLEDDIEIGSMGSGGKKPYIGEEYEDKYDADEFELDDEE